MRKENFNQTKARLNRAKQICINELRHYYIGDLDLDTLDLATLGAMCSIIAEEAY